MAPSSSSPTTTTTTRSSRSIRTTMSLLQLMLLSLSSFRIETTRTAVTASSSILVVPPPKAQQHAYFILQPLSRYGGRQQQQRQVSSSASSSPSLLFLSFPSVLQPPRTQTRTRQQPQPQQQIRPSLGFPSGTIQQQPQRQHRNVQCAVIPTPYFAENENDNNNNNSGSTAAASATTTTPTAANNNNNSQSLSSLSKIMQRLDEWAQQLKIAALQANAKSAIYATTNTDTNNTNFFRWRKYRYTIQACGYYTIFLLYRAYRGFFIILPAVFTETFRQLQAVIDSTPFDNNNDNDDDNGDNDTDSTATATSTTTFDDPKPKIMTLRTRLTISIVSVFVLFTYVLGGAIRVTTSMIRSMMNGSNLFQSLQYASQVQERNEMTLLQKSTVATMKSPAAASSSSTATKTGTDGTIATPSTYTGQRFSP